MAVYNKTKEDESTTKHTLDEGSENSVIEVLGFPIKRPKLNATRVFLSSLNVNSQSHPLVLAEETISGLHSIEHSPSISTPSILLRVAKKAVDTIINTDDNI